MRNVVGDDCAAAVFLYQSHNVFKLGRSLRLSRSIAWRLSWLTPLATGKNFKPQTEALIAVSRFVDDMVDGGSTPAIVDHVLALARKRAA